MSATCAEMPLAGRRVGKNQAPEPERPTALATVLGWTHLKAGLEVGMTSVSLLELEREHSLPEH